MAMWKLSKCPRCGGNIFIDIDIDGWFEECLQCSYRHDLESIADYEVRPSSKGEGSSPAEKATSCPICLIDKTP